MSDATSGDCVPPLLLSMLEAARQQVSDAQAAVTFVQRQIAQRCRLAIGDVVEDDGRVTRAPILAV